MQKIGRGYPSDLSEQHWKLIRRLIPKASTGGRPRSTDVRKVLNAIFYVNRTGCAWRYLPKEFPPWPTVYMYYARWKKQGVLKQVHDFLVSRVRKAEGRKEQTSVLMVDAQSVRAPYGEQRGWDGFKKVRGRKRNLIVDALGLIHSIKVDSAQGREHRSALQMLDPQNSYFPKKTTHPLQAFYADGGYKAHDFQNAVFQQFAIWPTLKSSQAKTDFPRENGYVPRKQITLSNLKPVRWIVERTFAWFGNYRRLSRDCERKTCSSEAMILIAMTQLMLRRLVRSKEHYRRWT